MASHTYYSLLANQRLTQISHAKKPLDWVSEENHNQVQKLSKLINQFKRLQRNVADMVIYGF